MVHGVTPEHIYPVIKLVADACGLTLIGSFSARTATRVSIEALPADDLQVAEAIKKAEGSFILYSYF